MTKDYKALSVEVKVFTPVFQSFSFPLLSIKYSDPQQLVSP